MVIIDTHIHVYPHYDTAVLFAAFLRNTRGLAASGTHPALAIALVERERTDIFQAWRDGTSLPAGARVATPDETAIRIELPDQPPILVLAGCQIACRERIEILGLGCRIRPADGTPARDAVDAIHAAGGVPVLAWGVGKWLFSRATVVRKLLEHFDPSVLVIGDSSLRPTFWPEPQPMRQARKEGRKVLAGSDPLPAAGEERMSGRYVTLLEKDPPGGEPASDFLRDALRNPMIPVSAAGRRNSVSEFLRRR